MSRREANMVAGLLALAILSVLAGFALGTIAMSQPDPLETCVANTELSREVCFYTLR